MTALAQLGDATPLIHGGYWVFEDHAVLLREKTGKYYQVHTFDIPICYFENSILSDNPYHKDYKAWFADKIKELASFSGMEQDEIIENICSTNPVQRAMSYRIIGDYFGYNNLECESETITNLQAYGRYNRLKVKE